MIISHKHSYIFFRAPKSASTSITATLQDSCGEFDIQAGIVTGFRMSRDEDYYNCPTQNCVGYPFRPHTLPRTVKKNVTTSLWKDYFKFTVIRNPWDLSVSRFYWNCSLKNHSPPTELIPLKRAVSQWVLSAKAKALNNQRFFFDQNGSLTCDFYIRFENLQRDFDRVSSLLGIEQKALIRTKTKLRATKFTYSQLLSREAQLRIAKVNKETIRAFGYSFAEKEFP